MSKLIQLAERCEQATGPDRKLDAEIAAAVHMKQLTYQSPEWITDPEFTALLDAAVTLVPEKLSWSVNHTYPPDGVMPYWAQIAGRMFTKDLIADGVGHTAALALCAAALRARASQEAK